MIRSPIPPPPPREWKRRDYEEVLAEARAANPPPRRRWWQTRRRWRWLVRVNETLCLYRAAHYCRKCGREVAIGPRCALIPLCPKCCHEIGMRPPPFNARAKNLYLGLPVVQWSEELVA